MFEISETQNPISRSYDEIPYPSHPIEATHPDHLYTIAKLFGLVPPIPDNASILELGCASGGNILPMAVQLPAARIVGVDISGNQIAEGQRMVEALGLRNVEFFRMDLQGIDAAFGQFDYILCHGVFSWVPRDVQNRILRICNERLSEFGVAYVSYNTYPGWFSRGLVRELMLPYVSQEPDARVRIQQARDLLSFMSASIEGQPTPYAKLLKSELELVAKNPDQYLFHEHLEEHNSPMFFHQFMEMATKHQLQFLGEAILPSMVIGNLPPIAAEALSKLTQDLCEQNQYMDFATNRMFRQTLLCRKDRRLDRHLGHSRLENGRFAGNFPIDNQQKMNDLHPAVEVVFQSGSGRAILTKDPVQKALLFTLADAWPGSLTAPELCDRMATRLSADSAFRRFDSASISALVSASMLHLVLRGDVSLRFLSDRFAMRVSEKPMVSALARLQASQGGLLTTQRHTMWNADPLTRLLLPTMDGTKTSESIGQWIGQLANGKVVQTHRPMHVDDVQKATLNKVLDQLRRAAMLVG